MNSYGRPGAPGLRGILCGLACCAILTLAGPVQAQGTGSGAGEAVPDGIGLIEAPEGIATHDPASILQEFGPEQGEPAAKGFSLDSFPQGPLFHPPVVVELFTSQGCSSCSAADELLAELSDRPDVLTLSWHVDYWDYLGWVDEFAQPEFTRRQKDYARVAGERSIYTPQILVGGTDTLIELRPADLMALIDNQLARPVAVSVTATPTEAGYQIELTPRLRSPRRMAILLVRYVPERVVEIHSGENSDRVLSYRNVVLAMEQVASWDGKAPLRLTVRSSSDADARYPDDTRHAILAQQLGRKDQPAGAILAAVRLD